MKITSTSGICKTLHYNGSHLLLYGKWQWSGFESSYEWFFLFWNKHLSALSTATYSFRMQSAAIRWKS